MMFGISLLEHSMLVPHFKYQQLILCKPTSVSSAGSNNHVLNPGTCSGISAPNHIFCENPAK